jgi:hypothetical protein
VLPRLGLTRVEQPLALRGERRARRVVEPPACASCKRFLDLEHLLEELRRRLRLDGVAVRCRLATFLEAHQVFDARDGIAQRAVGGVHAAPTLSSARACSSGGAAWWKSG